MYQCTPFSERYFDSAQHTEEELTQLYAMLIDDANDLAKQVPRDKDNRFYLTADANAETAKAMKAAAEDYPQLKGYYPKSETNPVFLLHEPVKSAGDIFFPSRLRQTTTATWSKPTFPPPYVTNTPT